MARTFYAFEHSSGRRAGAVGSGCSLAIRLSVGFGPAMKTMPLDGACESPALASADDIHPIAHLKYLNGDTFAFFEIAEMANSELPQVFQGRRVSAFQMAKLPTGQTFL